MVVMALFAVVVFGNGFVLVVVVVVLVLAVVIVVVTVVGGCGRCDWSPLWLVVAVAGCRCGYPG